MLRRLLSIPSSIILYSIGWSFLDKKIVNIINTNPRLVCVFSHTSYYDFFLMVLYYLSHPCLNLKTLVKPEYFDTIGYLLRMIGGIPSTNIKNKNGGAVDRIVNELLTTPKSLFLISPKGTILKGEWRSGYYHIAKKLKCPIVAIGLDYELKKIKIGKSIISVYGPNTVDQDEKDIRKLLYQDLSTIVPLHPEQENMIIRTHKKPTVINKLRFIIILYIIYLLL